MKIISNENFENELKNIAKEYDFELSDSVCRNLKIYKELLIDWNQKMNLTNITENYDIIIKHFIDCMQLLKYIDEKDKVIDVGTGAGMPGMVIAICFEDRLNITLLDSLNKRLIFLEEVKKTLGLKNVTIVHTRAEEGAHETEYREKFDVVVSRALASLNNLLEYTSGYLKVNGKMLFMKGNNCLEEIDSAKNAMNILNCKLNNIYNYDLKTQTEELSRSILEIIKYKNLLDKYPRNFGQMKKKPL